MSEENVSGVNIHIDESDDLKELTLLSSDVLHSVLTRNEKLREEALLFLKEPFVDGRFKWKIVRVIESSKEVVGTPSDISFLFSGDPFIDILYKEYRALKIQTLISRDRFNYLDDEEVNRIFYLCTEVRKDQVYIEGGDSMLLSPLVWSQIQTALVSQYRALARKGENFTPEDVSIHVVGEPTTIPSSRIASEEWIAVKGDPNGANIAEIVEGHGEIFVHFPSPFERIHPTQPTEGPMGVQKHIDELMEDKEYREIIESNPGLHTYVKELLESKLQDRPSDEIDIRFIDDVSQLSRGIEVGKAFCGSDTEQWIYVVYHYENAIYIQSISTKDPADDEPKRGAAGDAFPRYPFGGGYMPPYGPHPHNPPFGEPPTFGRSAMHRDRPDKDFFDPRRYPPGTMYGSAGGPFGYNPPPPRQPEYGESMNRKTAEPTPLDEDELLTVICAYNPAFYEFYLRNLKGTGLVPMKVNGSIQVPNAIWEAKIHNPIEGRDPTVVICNGSVCIFIEQ